MRKLMAKAATITFMASALAATGAGLAPGIAHASGKVPACPSGYACLYANPPTDGIIDQWTTYGYHNLSDIYGIHEFSNAQTGGALAYLCTGYDGEGTCTPVQAGSTVSVNFTPINSVYLAP
jgi:hypothetical protein